MRKQYHEVIKGKVSRGTGAKKVKAKDKKLAHAGGYFIPTRIGEREIKIIEKLPDDFIEEWNQLTNAAQVVWRKAKEEDNFESF
ncbi:MAG: hypothetical protein QXS91_02265, partial [Candidatus Anstonellales archaeon]